MTGNLHSLCSKCGRIIGYYSHTRAGNLSRGKYAYVVHDFFGCDTGCCGHKAYLCDENNEIIDEKFEFIHPYSMDEKEFISGWINALWCNVRIDWKKCQTSTD